LSASRKTGGKYSGFGLGRGGVRRNDRGRNAAPTTGNIACFDADGVSSGVNFSPAGPFILYTVFLA
jgi:hypothetical protein